VTIHIDATDAEVYRRKKSGVSYDCPQGVLHSRQRPVRPHITESETTLGLTLAGDLDPRDGGPQRQPLPAAGAHSYGPRIQP
jgi:hypothetical protein